MLFFMPGAVVIRARRDGPEVRLPPGWPGDFSFGNLRGLEVRSPGGIAAGTGMLVGMRRNSHCISRPGVVRRVFLQGCPGLRWPRFRAWMLPQPG